MPKSRTGRVFGRRRETEQEVKNKYWYVRKDPDEEDPCQAFVSSFWAPLPSPSAPSPREDRQKLLSSRSDETRQNKDGSTGVGHASAIAAIASWLELAHGGYALTFATGAGVDRKP